MNKEVKETTVKSTTQKKAAVKQETETSMYMGPTIRGCVIHGTLFKDGKLPEMVSKKIQNIPVLQSLFIPVSKLGEARKELSNSKSEISICYEKAVEALMEKED